MRIPAPNFTQTPNDLFDHWLPFLKEGELKVLLVIFRKTFGWHKNRDKISISQLVHMTGLSKPSVIAAAQTLQEKGIILKEVLGPIGKQETYYELVVIEDSNNSYPSKILTGTSKNSEPPPVKNFDTQKKDTKETKENIDKQQQQAAPPPTAVVGEKQDFGEIKYKTPLGKEKSINESDVYRHFVSLSYSTETLKKAIAIVRSKQEPIGNILKLIESICMTIENNHSKPVKSNEKSIKNYESPNAPPKNTNPHITWAEAMEIVKKERLQKKDKK